MSVISPKAAAVMRTSSFGRFMPYSDVSADSARKGYDDQLSSEPQTFERADNLFQSLPDGHATHGRFDGRARTNAPAFKASVVRLTIAFVSALIFAAMMAAMAAAMMMR
jgi:hypothetical protein